MATTTEIENFLKDRKRLQSRVSDLKRVKNLLHNASQLMLEADGTMVTLDPETIKKVTAIAFEATDDELATTQRDLANLEERVAIG